jgi:uncharacterized protein YndB with AHSA1/START domain
MKRLHIEAAGTADAPPEVVWRLVADAETYSKWGIWSESGWVSPVGDPPGSPGSARSMRYKRTTIVERILEVDEGARMAYTVLRGIPVRNYRAEVALTPKGAGTYVRWSAEWDNTLLGRVVQRRLSVIYPEVVRRLVAAAERTSRPPSRDISSRPASGS